MTFKEYFLQENTSRVILDFTAFRSKMDGAIRDLAAWSASHENKTWTEEEIVEFLNEITAETETNYRNKIVKILDDAIARVPNFKSQVRIVVQPNYDSLFKQYDLEAPSGDSAYVMIGSGNNGILVFQHENGKIEVDDILESGDEDEAEFFATSEEKADYYNLIKALQNPNAFKDGGKMLTLYTARPRKELNYYLATKTLPANIFLTNSYSHVQGLAQDLADGEPRVIFKVKVPEANVIVTYPGEQVKYYQLTAETKPSVMQWMS